MNSKHSNKAIFRGVILGGTVLAGLCIWVSINHTALPVTSNLAAGIPATTSNANPNFNPNDGFLTQPGIQNGPSGQSLPEQTAIIPATRLRTRGS